MSFNPLQEKGIPLDKQPRSWHDIVKMPFNKYEVDCYTRTRQILLNGIESEAWNFKHAFARLCPDIETVKILAKIKKIEDQHQTTVNWLAPSDQSVLETTLGFEQVAVDLTAWLAQNETDPYVKETFDFGLLEDFDHLYRYSQWYFMTEGGNPDDILQAQTDVILGRPTQNHHNDNSLRIRRHYNKTKTSPQTKVNILTLVSAEQQTHNYYAAHGNQYGSDVLRKTYAEIKDVEEEHVTMYESLIDPTESWYEKWLIHEFTEVCNYHNCMKDEEDDRLKKVWEELLMHEIEHLHIASDLLRKHDKRDPEEIIGTKVIDPCHFENQKKYVTKVLEKEVDKRLDTEMGYTTIDELPDNWPSYQIQRTAGEDGAPTEATIRMIAVAAGRDLVLADDDLKDDEVKLLTRGLETMAQAPDTVTPAELEEIIEVADIDDNYEE